MLMGFVWHVLINVGSVWLVLLWSVRNAVLTTSCSPMELALIPSTAPMASSSTKRQRPAIVVPPTVLSAPASPTVHNAQQTPTCRTIYAPANVQLANLVILLQEPAMTV